MRQLTGKLLLFISIAVLVAACAKETSYESGSNVNGQSVGTLKDLLGNCQDIVVNGTYKVDTALTADNYVLVQVNVTTPGQYNIYSDTSNGFWFRDSGYTSAGLHTIKLKGYGKPIFLLNTDFIVTYNNSFCTFTVTLSGTVATPVISDYFPTSIGSNWAYDVAGSTDTMHVDATAKDSIVTATGTSYRVFITKQAGVPTDTSIYRKDNAGNYYQYGAFDAYTTTPFEYIFLKDNQPAGTQWDSPTATTTYNGLSTEVKMHYIILAKNTSVTLNGNLIDSVIKVQNDLQYKVLGSFQTVTTGYTYFAKNIGLVDIELPGFYSQIIRRWKVY